MINKTLELSKLQLEVIDELEVLTDAFISTFTEIGKSIKEFSTDINVLIGNFILKDSAWKKLSNESYDLAYKPFCYDEAKKFLIDSLDFAFAIEGRVVLRKEIVEEEKKKYLNYFNLCWGFYYDKEEDPNKYFYIQLNREIIWGNAILPKNEYEEIANKIKSSIDCRRDSFYTIGHPDDEEDEFFHLCLDYKDADKLFNFLEISKEKFIENLLSKLKD